MCQGRFLIYSKKPRPFHGSAVFLVCPAQQGRSKQVNWLCNRLKVSFVCCTITSSPLWLCFFYRVLWSIKKKAHPVSWILGMIYHSRGARAQYTLHARARYSGSCLKRDPSNYATESSREGLRANNLAHSTQHTAHSTEHRAHTGGGTSERTLRTDPPTALQPTAAD